MHDALEFLRQCAQSGTLLRSLCALVILPATAWLACRFVAPHIVRMKDDPAWQAPLAAVAAGIPGALFVVLAASALVSGLSAACLAVPAGRVMFGLIIAAMTAALVRAAWLAVGRSISVRRLIAAAAAPSCRLQSIAASCGLQAREIPDAARVCALAGFISPVVLVSSGALAAVSDDELRAALQHERAHARRGDLLLAACLSFLVDLLPLPAGDLVETYRTAREFAADHDAVETTDADSLAGALIQFAKGGPDPVAAMSFAGGSRAVVAERLHLLLSDSAPARQRPLRRIVIAAALAVIAIAGVAAPAFAGQHPTCTLSMQVHR